MKSPWPTKKLGELVDKGFIELKRGYIISQEELRKNPGNYPVYSSSIENNGLFGYWDRYMFDEEMITWSIDGGGNFFYRPKHKFSVTNVVGILRSNIENLNVKFLYYTLSWQHSKLEFDYIKKAHPSVIKNLYFVIFPPLPIQQKIVSILDTIQEAINIQNKIIETTKELKKSMMADLFKYGGPSFRKNRKLKKTEIGEIPEDWEVVRLGEIAEVVRGASPRPKGDSRFFSKKPTSIHWITISDINKYTKGMFLTNTDEYLTEDGKKLSRYLEKGTLIVTNSGTVGIPIFLGINGCIHDGYLAFLNISSKVEKTFLYFLINFMRSKIEKLAPKGTQANLNTYIVKNFKIHLPPLPEQREIAEILQTIDQKIEIEQKKKELYEELFKTMLDKIFTGEIDIEKIEI